MVIERSISIVKRNGPYWPLGDRVQLDLAYKGLLPSSNTSRVKQINHIRAYLHPQLARLCRLDEHLIGALDATLPKGICKGKRVRVEGQETSAQRFFSIEVGGVCFVPLVTQFQKLVVQLSVVLYRNDKPGDILTQSGDLDGRLKTLLDALRMPREPQELKGLPRVENNRYYCLLEDDALITKITIEMCRSPRPLQDNRQVDVRIQACIWTSLTIP